MIDIVITKARLDEFMAEWQADANNAAAQGEEGIAAALSEKWLALQSLLEHQAKEVQRDA
jgi:hypothetical protein